MLFGTSTTLSGDDAMWAGLTLTFLSRHVRPRDEAWADKMQRVGDCLSPGRVVRIEPLARVFAVLGFRAAITEADAISCIMALLFLSNQLKEQEPTWAEQLRRVANVLRPGYTLHLGPYTRPSSAESNDDGADKRAARLRSMIGKTDIIGSAVS